MLILVAPEVDCLVRVWHFFEVAVMFHDLLVPVHVALVLTVIPVIQPAVLCILAPLVILLPDGPIVDGLRLEVKICLPVAQASQSRD